MDISIFSFPANLIFAISFCAIVYVTYDWYKRSEWLHSNWLVLAFMGSVAFLTAVEGVWKLDVQHSIPFLLSALVTMYLAGLATYDAIVRKFRLSYIFSHLGFFLIFFGVFFGAPDFTEASIIANKETTSIYAQSNDGYTVPLNFGIKLKDFTIDYYENCTSPKQYTSTIQLIEHTADGLATLEKTTSVNHPCHYRGWLIYQSDYDHDTQSYSVLHLVKDPWLPLIFLGMALLALGAVLGLRGTWHSKAVLPVAICLAAVFGAISMARISLGTLAPALRSLWFIPHLIVYMIAYSLLAIALVVGAVALIRNMSADSALARLPLKLLSTSSALLIVGMLCGAAWAKVAWGDYWAWDPKECWAAATWLITLIGTHLPTDRLKIYFAERKTLFIIVLIILVAFLAMQITWYGVNWLPSAQYSMHTYNIN